MWCTGTTFPLCKAGHDVVQFGHFGQDWYGEGALPVATAPIKYMTSKCITHYQLQQKIQGSENSLHPRRAECTSRQGWWNHCWYKRRTGRVHHWCRPSGKILHHPSTQSQCQIPRSLCLQKAPWTNLEREDALKNKIKQLDGLNYLNLLFVNLFQSSNTLGPKTNITRIKCLRHLFSPTIFGFNVISIWIPTGKLNMCSASCHIWLGGNQQVPSINWKPSADWQSSFFPLDGEMFDLWPPTFSPNFFWRSIKYLSSCCAQMLVLKSAGTHLHTHLPLSCKQ